MIIDFTIRNFLSFKDEQSLSFIAAPPYTQHPNHLLDTPDKDLRLLKSIVIYGANAAGKSNLLVALHRLKNLIVNSSKQLPNDEFDILPFLLGVTNNEEPTSFEINFYCQSIKYNYYLELNEKKVLKEFLYSYPKKYRRNVFERELIGDKYYYKLGTDLAPKRVFDDVAIRTSPNILFLSKAAQENNPALKIIYNWFANNLVEEASINKVAKSLLKSTTKKEKLLNILQNYDIDIADIKVTEKFLYDVLIENNENKMSVEEQEKIKDSLKDERMYRIQNYHLNANNHPIPLDFRLESTGTQKLFELSELLITENDHSKFFYIDEMNTALHPLLAQKFLENFHSSTNNQLVFTTHDTHLINSEFLRKDQVYFVEKRRNKASYLYSLLEFDVRNDRENWELRYLSGQYGATPYFKNTNFKED